MKQMKVVGAKVYRTPNSPQGMYSVGLSVASKLNGNNDGLVATYKGGNTDGRYLGFIANSNKFGVLSPSDIVEGKQVISEERLALAEAEAKAFATKLEKKYPRGFVMPAKDWGWGEELDDAPEGSREVLFFDGEGVPQKQDDESVREGLKSGAPAQ